MKTFDKSAGDGTTPGSVKQTGNPGTGASMSAWSGDLREVVDTVDRLSRALSCVRVLAEAGHHYVDQNYGVELEPVDIDELFKTIEQQQRRAIGFCDDLCELIACGKLQPAEGAQ